MMTSNKYSILHIFKFLEDPNHPSIGPHLKLLGFIGLWHPDSNSKITRFKNALCFITVFFFFTQYIKCMLKFDPDSLKLILQYAPFHMGIVKVCFFQKFYKTWESVIQYMSSVERSQIDKNQKRHSEIISNYISRNRRVSYFFRSLAFFSNFSIFSEPYQKNQVLENGTSVYLNIFDGYSPFSAEPPGYYCSMFIQTVLGHIVSAYVVGWDTLVVTIMIFFAGQLKISRLNCSQIIIVEDPAKSHQNIVQCHRFHVKLAKYQKRFNALISPVMFVYLIIISVNLGVCIIQIVQIQNDRWMLASSCLFVLACLIQLLLFYWFSNEVTIESQQISYGIFESQWPQSSKILQKEVALLGLTTEKVFLFKAGPYYNMSLTTFIAILRASYSFYALLNSTTTN